MPRCKYVACSIPITTSATVDATLRVLTTSNMPTPTPVIPSSITPLVAGMLGIGSRAASRGNTSSIDQNYIWESGAAIFIIQHLPQACM